MVDFPDIPKPHIRKILYGHKSLYAPTHLHFLAEKERGPPFPYIPKKIAYKLSGKGKRRELVDAEFNIERAWLLEKLKSKEVEMVAEQQAIEEECEDGIECGCCFSTYPFVCCFQRSYISLMMRFFSRTRSFNAPTLISSARNA